MGKERVAPIIDQEFASLIPPLTDEEFNQLRDNILADNEVHSPLILWNGILIDGHNRWRVISENPGIVYATKELIFFSREDVIEWICKNQLGRRNLTEKQKMDLVGRMQRARKKSHGGERGNQYTAAPKGQNEPLPKSTAAQIAAEVGVSESFVKRAEKFADGVDAIREVSPEAAEKVLSGKSGKTNTEVMKAAKMDAEERDAFVESIVSPPEPEEKKVKKEPEQYSLDDLTAELASGADKYIASLSALLDKRMKLFPDAESRETIANVINGISRKISGMGEKIK